MAVSFGTYGQRTNSDDKNTKLTPKSTNEKLPRIAPDALPPLRSLIDETLQTELENQLNANPRWKNLISQKKMSVGLVDLSNPDQTKFARVNGLYMMYAASLPKIAVLLASMDALEKGELTETPEIRSDMRIMISKSNNQAASRMIDRVGFEKIESVMTDPLYEFYDEDLQGGLWVGKRYGSGDKTNREPLKQFSHAASATQVCRFYYLMSYGKLVNPKRSKEMLDIMENPELHHKFVSSIEKLAPNARLFRKSGSWRTFHSDSILVWGPKRKYILVALVDDVQGEQIIRQIASKMDQIVKIKK